MLTIAISGTPAHINVLCGMVWFQHWLSVLLPGAGWVCDVGSSYPHLRGLFAFALRFVWVLLMQIPGVLSLIDDITLGPYSIMDADHMDPHIAGVL
jgi:hypothetical protein